MNNVICPLSIRVVRTGREVLGEEGSTTKKENAGCAYDLHKFPFLIDELVAAAPSYEGKDRSMYFE